MLRGKSRSGNADQLFPLPPDTILRVFNYHTFVEKFIADLIGTRKIAQLLGLRALRHELFDIVIAERHACQQLGCYICLASRLLCPRKRALRRLRIAVRNHIEHCIEIRRAP